jgi:uncharacterized membrane protein
VVVSGLLLAITLLMAFTPVGFIPMPTPAGSATIAHIPAIIGAILEGPLVGLIVSLGFGFGSFFSPLVPVKDPLVIILPRLLIGPVTWWVFAALRRARVGTLTGMLAVLLALLLAFSYQVAQQTLWLGMVVAVVSAVAIALLFIWVRREESAVVSLAVAGAAGSLTNTVMVLSAAVLRQIPGITSEVAWGIAITHGIPEMFVSAVITAAVVAAIRQIGTRRGSRL